MQSQQRFTLLKLPNIKQQINKPDKFNHSFQSFIFKDNFTKNKILLKDLAQKSKTIDPQMNSTYQCSTFKKRFGYRIQDLENSTELKQLQSNFNILKNRKQFQISSVKERDSKYTTGLVQIQEIKQFTENIKLKSIFAKKRITNKIRNSNSILITKPPKIEENNHTEILKKKSVLRHSKICPIPIDKQSDHQTQSDDQHSIQEYKQTFNQIKRVVGDDISNLQQDLKKQQNQFLNKMKFYLKRTLIKNGQYLIKPEVNELKKIKIQESYKENFFKQADTETYLIQPTILDPKFYKQLPDLHTEIHQKKLSLPSLINQNVVLNSQQKKLINSIKKDDIFQIMYLIEKYPYLIKLKDNKGNNLLHHAAKVGNIEIIKYLQQKGINIKQMNNFNQSPLDICKHFGYTKIAQLYEIEKIFSQ